MNSTKHAMINTSICGSEGIQMLLVETKNSLSAQFYCTVTKTVKLITEPDEYHECLSCTV